MGKTDLGELSSRTETQGMREDTRGEAKGRQREMGSGGVGDMAFLGADGVLRVAEVEEGDRHRCEEVERSG